MNIVWTYRNELFAPDPAFGADALVVPNTMTPLGADEAARALAAGYKRAVGHLPSPAVLDLLLAQWALETGNGKYIHNHNLGNVKYHSGAPAKVYFRCSEIIGGVEVWFDPPAPQCAFAAYPDAASGAEAYVRILGKRSHWWVGLHTGDVEQFNTALSTAPRYYTANPQLYLRTLKDRADTYAGVARQYGYKGRGWGWAAGAALALAAGGAVYLRRTR